MSEFKVGDKVVLRPETKPYFGASLYWGKISKQIEEIENLEVERILDEYDCIVVSGGFLIKPCHLKHVEEQFNEYLYELRLDIFKTNPNLSVNEMQEIEKWLLNK